MSASPLRRSLQGKTPPTGPAANRRNRAKNRDYKPVIWKTYFEEKDHIEVSEEENFCAYKRGSSGPLLLLLHGGGYSGLTWALFADQISRMVDCRVLALDLRGHGETYCNNEDDLSANRLCLDVRAVLEKLFGEEIPSIILIGHSMGGGIAVRLAHNQMITTILALVVIDVVEGTALDSLQGMQGVLKSRPKCFKSMDAAIEWAVRTGQTRNLEAARVSMPAQLKNMVTEQPATVELDERSLASDSNKSSGGELSSTQSPSYTSPPATPLVAPAGGVIQEEEEEEEQELLDVKPSDKPDDKPANTDESVVTKENETDEAPSESKDPVTTEKEEAGGSNTPETSECMPPPPPSGSCLPPCHVYAWRINLFRTEKFWREWFQGLSKTFLDTSVPKLLLLAGMDRLDRELTIGQMQGKFQLQVMPQAGHAVHEDVPDKVAEVVASFMVRNRFATAKDGFHPAVPGC